MWMLRNEKMNAKIREHAMQKVPFLLVVGDKEEAENQVNVRTRGKGDEGVVSVEPTSSRVSREAGG